MKYLKFLRATQGSSLVIFGLVFAVGMAVSQTAPSRTSQAVPAVSPTGQASVAPVRVFPRVRLQSGLDLTYLGMFSPDALFHARTKLSGFNGVVPGEGIVPGVPSGDRMEKGDAPAWMLLSSERTVENLETPAHLQAGASINSRPTDLRNHFVTYAYGRPSVILAPKYVVTDTQHRLILSDPDALAIHVLDPWGKNSFRLVCGKGYRVQKPAGVASDADDNIYVADSERGMVAVFNSSGIFMRYIGSYHGEPIYASPRGIAIDLTRRRLFIVDTPRNQVFETDLEGKPVKRLGKSRHGDGVGELESPTDITLNHNHIFVLDRWGTRVQVLNTDFDPIGSFDVSQGRDRELYFDNGLGTDMEGHVLVSFNRGASVRVYNPDGQLLAAFGQSGILAGQFAGPRGLWIDGHDRLYVADSGNGRVQMFQLKYSE